MNNPTIKEMIEDFNIKLTTTTLDDTNFDKSDIVNFNINDNVSLLDEGIHNNTLLDSANRDDSTTPTD